MRTIAGATIAPVAAIQHGAPGTFVFLVKPDGTVAVQKVTTGVANGDRTQIVSGLKAGDTSWSSTAPIGFARVRRFACRLIRAMRLRI